MGLVECSKAACFITIRLGCAKNQSGLWMHVLQTTWRSAKQPFNSVRTYHRQAQRLTVTWLHRRAPRILPHNRGGQSTSDKSTTSALSPLLFPISTETCVIIVDVASFVSSLLHYKRTTVKLNNGTLHILYSPARFCFSTRTHTQSKATPRKNYNAAKTHRNIKRIEISIITCTVSPSYTD